MVEYIVNTETNTPTTFNVVPSRKAHLIELLNSQELPVLTPWGTGVEGAAVRGMNCLFETIPPKFPLEALLNWLHQDLQNMVPYVITRSQVESALIELARIYA